MERDFDTDQKAIGCMHQEAFQTSGCQLSPCSFIDEGIPSPTAEKSAGHPGSKLFRKRFDSLVCWLLHRLIPEHLAKNPPPDRQIYY